MGTFVKCLNTSKSEYKYVQIGTLQKIGYTGKSALADDTSRSQSIYHKISFKVNLLKATIFERIWLPTKCGQQENYEEN